MTGQMGRHAARNLVRKGPGFKPGPPRAAPKTGRPGRWVQLGTVRRRTCRRSRLGLHEPLAPVNRRRAGDFEVPPVVSEPAVSIVLPTYNRAAFLPAAVGSVLAQSFADWEFLV